MKLFGQGFGQLFCLFHIFNEQGQGFMARARFDFVHPLYRSKIKGIGSQSIKSISRHAQNLPGANLVGCVPDQRRFRSLAVDLHHFYAHTNTLPEAGLFAKAKITRRSSTAERLLSGSRMILGRRDQGLRV